MAHLSSEGRITNIKLVEPSTTIAQQTATTNNWYDVDHSTISYKPTAGSDYVLYEYSFWFGTNDGEDKAYGTFKLVYSDDAGSTWTDMTNGTTRIGSDESTGYLRYKGVVTIARMLESWSSDRILKLQFKRGGNSFNCRLHQYTYFRDADGDDTNNPYYKPFVICSSFTNGE